MQRYRLKYLSATPIYGGIDVEIWLFIDKNRVAALNEAATLRSIHAIKLLCDRHLVETTLMTATLKLCLKPDVEHCESLVISDKACWHT